MRRTEQAQGLRLMKFEEVYGRTCRGVLGQAEAAEISWAISRDLPALADRFEADGGGGSLRPPPGPPLGTSRAGGAKWRRAA